MPSYPTERMTRDRTLSDEIYAIVYKAIDKRPIPEADIELEHLVYCDNNCGSGNPDPTPTTSTLIIATNADKTGLVDENSNATPTPATVVVDDDGEFVTLISV